MARVGKKAGMIAGIAIAALALAAGIALAVYVDNNRHGEERDLARAHAAGFNLAGWLFYSDFTAGELGGFHFIDGHTVSWSAISRFPSFLYVS